MNTNNANKDLEKISKYLGIHVEYAQGGGGNTSVKIDHVTMLIKASGFSLADVSLTEGFVHIDYVKYRELLLRNIAVCDEQQYTDFGLTCLTLPSKLKPSIETCFHALLDNTHVIHSHSVFANIISCSEEGRTIAQELFPEAIFIPYVTPGKELAKNIIKLPKNNPKNGQIIFLQNHGVIVGGNSADDCIGIHELMNDIIKKKFNLSPSLDEKYRSTFQVPILFPDQAVYSKSVQESKAGIETLMAANYIFTEIKRLNLTPKFLQQTDVDYLLNMESEKYRIKMAGK